MTPAPAAGRGGAHPVRHISRDHAYVVDELKRIALIVAFIVVGLGITAFLR